MKKPDRLERKLERESRDGVTLTLSSAIKLLRAEHAWMRRQIKEIDRVSSRKDVDISPSVRVGMAAVLDDLERRLTQRRK